ncbi:hypothetical protein [Nitrincola tibetensis]|uniref:hypothetical protein n=1 Tax=Nitrincola tibetensis TaxID=2219697 RepID=UPI0012E3A0D8|nr:hypothetical protein [Nitrincola tibetensis]
MNKNQTTPKEKGNAKETTPKVANNDKADKKGNGSKGGTVIENINNDTKKETK